MKLLQVLTRHGGRRALEQRARRRGLRKCNHVAQRRGAGELHRDPIEAERNAAVRRRPGAQSLQQKAEAGARRRFIDAKQREDARLQRWITDTNTAPPEFGAVQHDVVRARAYRLRRAVELRDIGRVGRRERVMHRRQATGARVSLE